MDARRHARAVAARRRAADHGRRAAARARDGVGDAAHPHDVRRGRAEAHPLSRALRRARFAGRVRSPSCFLTLASRAVSLLRSTLQGGFCGVPVRRPHTLAARASRLSARRFVLTFFLSQAFGFWARATGSRAACGAPERPEHAHRRARRARGPSAAPESAGADGAAATAALRGTRARPRLAAESARHLSLAHGLFWARIARPRAATRTTRNKPSRGVGVVACRG